MDALTEIKKMFIPIRCGRVETAYGVGDAAITVRQQEGRSDQLYEVGLPEMSLSSRDRQQLLDQWTSLTEGEWFGDDLTGAIQQAIHHTPRWAPLLTRHTTGFGVLDPLFQDEHITDVFVESGTGHVRVTHQQHGNCTTNLRLTRRECARLASLLRRLSGRPLDRSSPILHAEIPCGVRACAVVPPATYEGIGFAFRRRKSEPWTLADLMRRRMLDASSAGVLSFLMHCGESILITGPRSAGKTSLLTALLLEIPRHRRIIVIEDTPELPVHRLRELGFSIEHLRITTGEVRTEKTPEDIMRTALRLGDSVLVLGEVRGEEARTLFEAMRFGGGNTVLGTIHGSTPEDAKERVISDLGVPRSAFNAVDVVVSVGMIQQRLNHLQHRRLLRISEHDNGFHDLATYHRPGWRVRLAGSRMLSAFVERTGLSRSEALKVLAIRKHVEQSLANSDMGASLIAESNGILDHLLMTEPLARVEKAWKQWMRRDA